MRAIYATFFKPDTDNLLIQLLRYAIVGAISFVADFGTLYLFTEILEINYLISASLGFVVGVLINYVLSIRWVFKASEESGSRSAEFIGWIIIGVLGLGLNALVMWIFTDMLSFYYLGSKLFSTGIVFSWNFFARRYLISLF